MNSKLTLNLDTNLIDKAKEYAKSEGRSLSEIVEEFFKSKLELPETTKIGKTPIVDSLRGSFKVPENFNYKQELENSLIKKYL